MWELGRNMGLLTHRLTLSWIVVDFTPVTFYHLPCPRTLRILRPIRRARNAGAEVSHDDQAKPAKDPQLEEQSGPTGTPLLT